MIWKALSIKTIRSSQWYRLRRRRTRASASRADIAGIGIMLDTIKLIGITFDALLHVITRTPRRLA
jgi:hypothetical protein